MAYDNSSAAADVRCSNHGLPGKSFSPAKISTCGFLFDQSYMCVYRHSDIYTRIGRNCIRGMSSTPSPPLTLRFFDHFNTLPLHLIDRCLNLNSCLQPPPHTGLIDFNFGVDFGDFSGDFGATFGFDADFGGV